MGLVDNRTITVEQQALLEQYELAQKQVQKLTDIAEVLEHAVISIDKGADSNEKMLSNMGTLLIDVREQLSNLPKDVVEIPDQSRPVVEGLQKLEKELAKAIKGQKLVAEAPVVNVEAPRVEVDAPDLRGVEKILKDLPKALDKAVSSIQIPNIPEMSVEPVVEKLRDLEEILESIDRASRMKPTFPTTLKVTNPDGSVVGGATSTVYHASINQGAAGTDILVAAQTGLKVRVISYAVVVGSAATVKFTGSGDLTGAMPLAANGGISAVGDKPLFSTTAGQALSIVTTGAAAKGYLSYVLE